MIVVNQHLQVIGCTICNEMLELRRNTIEAPELLAMVRSEWELEHKPCTDFPNDPARARAERKYCAGMRAAFRKADTVKPVFARRCRPR